LSDDAITQPSQPISETTALAEWNNGILLIEAALSEDADGVTVQTTWQARAPAQRDFTLFVHLLDAGGQLVAQQDQQPQHGQLPTSVWQAGELIHEEIVVKVPAEKRKQWTTAMIGIYDSASGERAKRVSGLAEHDEDIVVLQRRR
jgi:hypothetical protein